ncbi:MAG TPA: hypothetical protein VGT61_07430, partial [Thermomicrobiales bacterium]|nr:hypothetical protein [Thermomicrobiales bacterium]
MDASRFDAVSRLFAQRRSRRAALTTAATLAAGALTTASQGATPATGAGAPASGTPAAGGTGTPDKLTFLFVQSFQAGTISPKEGADGRYTLTLEAGLGQTVYFS